MLNRVIVILCTLCTLLGCTSEVITEQEAIEMAPPVMTGWSQAGNIRPGNQFQAVGMQCQFQEIGNYTIQFNVQDPNTGLAIGNRILLRAEINWSVKGNTIRRVMDVGDGAAITGTAEAVNVKVYDASTITSPAAVRDVAVSVLCSKGTRASTQRPPVYSLAGDTVGPAADSTIFVIPDDVGAISAFVAVAPDTIGTAIGAYDILVQQAGNVSGSSILNEYDPRQSDWVPLVAGTKSLVVSSSAAAPLTVITPILGIDG